MIKPNHPLELACKFNKGGIGGIIGGVTDAVGLTDYKGQERAQKSAQKSAELSAEQSAQIAKDQIAFQEKELEFTKDQYADWEAVFGELSSNLGEYYNNLTPEKFVTPQLAEISREYQRATQQLQRNLAQRGISGGGAEAAGLTALAQTQAAQQAQVRGLAGQQIAQQQQGYLGLGYGQGAQYLGAVGAQTGRVGQVANAAANTIMQGGSLQSGIQSTYANNLLQTNAQMMQSFTQPVLSAGGGFLSGKLFG